jgi:hypothetical protein
MKGSKEGDGGLFGGTPAGVARPVAGGNAELRGEVALLLRPRHGER